MTDRFLEILFNPLHRALKWYDDTIGFACTRRAALWYSASVTIAAVIIALAPNPDLNAEAFWLTGMAPIIFALGGLLFFNLCVLVPVVGIASVFDSICSIANLLLNRTSKGKHATPSVTMARSQTACETSKEEDAVEITADFGEAYATCNEERWLFKPQSLLPRDSDTIVHAMKLSYQTGYPFNDKFEGSYRHCFPQIAFFVPDDQFDRALTYFERLREAVKNERDHSLFLNFEWAGAVLNCACGMSANGDEFKDVFESTFLADAPADPDKFWVQQLARDCWRDFRSRIAEWSQFVTLVKAGETGLGPKDVALARIELDKTRREIGDSIRSLQQEEQKSIYAKTVAQID